MQHGDYQLEIYGAGLKGVLPRWPVDFAGLEAAAGASLPDWILNYVAGGAGDERTQRGNAEAFGWWGIVPRMMNGAYERDLSTSICGIDLPTPLFCCPSGSSASARRTSTGTSRLPAPAPGPACRW